jgi:hypothetical protein
MSITAVSYKCDRDGVEAASANTFQPPTGWTTLAVTMGAGKNVSLCPACSALFVTFMQGAGQAFDLNPAPTPPAA